MGKRSRDKGARNEVAIVNMLNDAGIPAERVPLSGACGGLFAGDVIVDGQKYEAKIRGDGFRELYKWLGDDNAGLFLRADRKELLIVLRAADWIASRNKNGGE